MLHSTTLLPLTSRPTRLRTATIFLIFCMAAVPCIVRAEVVETRTLERSVAVDAQSAHLVVRDVFGSVRVTAHDRDTIDMTATETIRGDLRSDIERARAEVGLRVDQDASGVAFRVRRLDDQCQCASGSFGNRWDGYVVEYDIEIKVPRDASLDLSTVSQGEIVVSGVRGDFDVSNVNGAVRLDGLRGAGTAKTVNGPLEASFDRAPAGDTSFKTVNGAIDVGFPADLAADLAFKTMHGEIWTDFDSEPIAATPQRQDLEGRRGAAVFRLERSSAVRVGAGGPTYSFETLNGRIDVRRLGQ